MEAQGSDRRVKSASAFLTISEVSATLNVPQHILRFWETKFPQLRPLKRAGGRRYFRPEDVALLERISTLLGPEGYTIRGVQKLMREGEMGRPAPRIEEASLPLGLDALDQTETPAATVAAAAKNKAQPRARSEPDQVSRPALRALLAELVEIRKIIAR